MWDVSTSFSESSKTLKMVAVPSSETSVTTGWITGTWQFSKWNKRNSSVFRDSPCIYKHTRRNTSEDLGHQSSGFSVSEQIPALCGTHNSGSHSSSRPCVCVCVCVCVFFFYGEKLLFPRQPPSWSNIPCRLTATTYWLYSQLSFIAGGGCLSTTWGHPYYSERGPLNMDAIKTVYITNLWTAVAQWLRCCATNRKVAALIPADVIGIFHWLKFFPITLWPWGRLSL